MAETTLLVDLLCARVVFQSGSRGGTRCESKTRCVVTLRDLGRIELPQLPRDWAWGARIDEHDHAVFDVPLCGKHAHE